MSEIEREKFESVILGMGEEEQKFAVANIDTDILWNELMKRERQERNMCIAMQEVMTCR